MVLEMKVQDVIDMVDSFTAEMVPLPPGPCLSHELEGQAEMVSGCHECSTQIGG